MSTVLKSVVTGDFVAKNGKGETDGGKNTEVEVGLNAQKVVSMRYSLKDINGAPLENWGDIVRRVVGHVSTAETDPVKREMFYDAMTSVMLKREFIPNTPCLVNAGKPKGQLAACFVLNVPDSIQGIMQHAENVAIIHQTGGGTGMTYEFLRPAGSMVNSTRGVASGPVSFMNIVNQTTEVVKQGGVRRGANMGILSIKHPDVLRFIHAKNDQHSLTNFNISVTVTDKFMGAVDNKEWFLTEFHGEDWNLPVHDPLTGADYVVYRRPDGSTVTFADRLAFETADLSNTTVETAPKAGMVYAPDIWI
jgi:ribonucleoside-diphosphate reductase alpha chain